MAFPRKWAVIVISTRTECFDTSMVPRQGKDSSLLHMHMVNGARKSSTISLYK